MNMFVKLYSEFVNRVSDDVVRDMISLYSSSLSVRELRRKVCDRVKYEGKYISRIQWMKEIKLCLEDAPLIEPKKYTVYVHEFPNGKFYVGITSQIPEKRWRDGEGYVENPEMYAAVCRYGWGNIEHHIVDSGLSYEEADYLESILISKYYDVCYNRDVKGCAELTI